ncbi:MAG: type II toxin-antitoxin system VapC family toxin [Polyangiaceae bacterium]|nr:type II toxin-antitoxin system VapC family toxin [Polyangiaceae bacterium]
MDTSVLVDHLRGVTQATSLLRSATRSGISLCSLTVVRTEILAGMRPKEEKQTMLLFGVLQWIDITREIADAAGALARRYTKSHPTIDIVDYLLAGASRRTGAQLITLNIKHFPMFPRLQSAYSLPLG